MKLHHILLVILIIVIISSMVIWSFFDDPAPNINEQQVPAQMNEAN